MPHPRCPIVRAIAPVVTAALLTAGCSDDDDAADTTPSPTIAATATTEATTTTSTTSTTLPPTTPAPAPTFPLTGLPPADAALLARPALIVKIDNATPARPQSGLNQADVVYEELVEGISRFAAVFHSGESDPVGPIRSGRTSDIDIAAQLGQPLFAWSGGNPGVTEAIRSSGFMADIGPNVAPPGTYYRDGGRPRPHNYYSRTPALFGLALDGQAPPPDLFAFRKLFEGSTQGIDAAGAKVTMLGTRVQWDWDEALAGWARTQDGRPHVDADGVRIAPNNVVVQFVDYRPSPADRRSPEAVTVGSGGAVVLTDGQAILGTWERPDRAQPTVYRDASGEVIELTPGRTWVQLALPDQAAIVPAGTDPSSVEFPRVRR